MLSAERLDHALTLVGQDKRYQIFITTLVYLFAFISTYFSQTYPFMQDLPVVTFTNEKSEVVVTKLKYEYCGKYDFHIVEDQSNSNFALDFGLYCSPFEVGMIGTIFLIGSCVGMFVALLLDIIGRRLTWIINCILLLPATGMLFLKVVPLLYVSVFILGIVYSLTTNLKNTVVSEHLSTKTRPIAISLIYSVAIPVSLLGYLLNSILAGWKLTYLLIGIISFVLLILISLLTVENPRYYAMKKKIEPFFKSLNYIRRFNGVNPQEITTQDFPELVENTELIVNSNNQEGVKTDEEEGDHDLTIHEMKVGLVKRRDSNTSAIVSKVYLKKFGILSLLIVSSNFSFYLGISELRSYDKNLLFYIFSIPHLLTYMLNGIISRRFGRKKSIYLFLGIVCLCDLLKICFDFNKEVSFIIFIIKRISTFVNIAATWTIVTESINTNKRSRGLFIIGLFAKGISSLSPLVYEYLRAQMYIIDLCMCLAGLVAIYFIPETLGKTLE